MKVPVIAIVGRANVGKSTLFNRLTASNTAIVDDRPGITRDRLYGRAEQRDGTRYVVVDTGGFETQLRSQQDDGSTITSEMIWTQSELAVAEADLILFVVDAAFGVHPDDEVLWRLVQRTRKLILVLANKVDGREQEVNAHEFFRLGADEVLSISAQYKFGLSALWKRLAEVFPSDAEALDSSLSDRELTASRPVTRVAIIGRPNVGKSSIMNRLVGEERALVSEVAGTTRDPIDSRITFHGRTIVLVDTAGVRKRSRVSDRIDAVSMIRSVRAMEQADVVVLVLAADQGFLSDQDARLASMAAEQMKPLLIVVNKWDLVLDKTSQSPAEYEQEIRDRLHTLDYAPVVFVSCTENQRVHDLFDHVVKLHDESMRRVHTAAWNDVLQRAVQEHTPAVIKQHGKRVKFYYATQVDVCPPSAIVFCNIAGDIHESYKRYLLRRFRNELGFTNVPLKLIYRGKSEQKAATEEREALEDQSQDIQE